MKRFAPVLMLLLLLSPTLFAAEDMTGKWSGTVVMTKEGNPPESRTATLLMILKQTGKTLTGTAGPSENEQRGATIKGTVETIKKDGKDVTNVTLDVTPDGDEVAMRFLLTVVDGHLKGKGQHEFEGQKVTGVLDLTRLK